MRNTTALGDRSELEVAAALTRCGRNVLRPLSASLRYDLAVDNGDGTITRIQCKTGLLKDGAVYFRAHNPDARRPNGVPYRGQVEAFGVYGQVKGVLFAQDFVLSTAGHRAAGNSF